MKKIYLTEEQINNMYADLIPDRSEEDFGEEERQFYEDLGDCCYRGLDCFNEAIDLINSPYGKSHEKELAVILKNVQHICERIENIWDEYKDE